MQEDGEGRPGGLRLSSGVSLIPHYDLLVAREISDLCEVVKGIKAKAFGILLVSPDWVLLSQGLFANEVVLGLCECVCVCVCVCVCAVSYTNLRAHETG